MISVEVALRNGRWAVIDRIGNKIIAWDSYMERDEAEFFAGVHVGALMGQGYEVVRK